MIRCDFAEHGCSAVVGLDGITSHLESCEHNPKKPVTCEKGCGLVIPKDEIKEHNCAKNLRAICHTLQQQMSSMQAELTELKTENEQLRREMQLVRDFIRAVRGSNPTMMAIADQLEQSEVVRWSNSLQRARVTRWGGMISTPDTVLQAVIRRALAESGCPPLIINDLMENSHERRWPSGLSTLETRQMNRRFYDNYVCRRVPGRQAVVVMACENQHMNEDMLMEPGVVMIFAHGVE
ncbi:unnamed protein product [Darwinula stevensoni]|uniref:E3 ubiquitin-protein ligase NRDP1 domain-containing protein n=1 Tax=Darwinula stevensoni TaxID=69355 RepID=A0A7R8X9D9_9CRUS|nr:unnamed protein product [Darwinula stevensoni]CAG0884283.1 unnamed protein product [Darwinula stevensoni]